MRLEEIRQRHFDRRIINCDDDEEWITINGAHIPVNKEGDLQGKVGEKISEENKYGKYGEGPLTSKNRDKICEKMMDEWVKDYVSQEGFKPDVGSIMAQEIVYLRELNNEIKKSSTKE